MWKKIKRVRKLVILFCLTALVSWYIFGGHISSLVTSGSRVSEFLGSILALWANNTATPEGIAKTFPKIVTLSQTKVGNQRNDQRNGILPTLHPDTLGIQTTDDCSQFVRLQSPRNTFCLPFWQRRALRQPKIITDQRKPYFVSELLHVRIYPRFDKAKWTIKELKQWIHFLLLAGIEHIYICNHFIYEDEIIEAHLKRYIALRLVTCIPWNEGQPWSTENQIGCYKHFIRTYRDTSRWHIDVDMDEYPWNPGDNKEGFLRRYVQNMELRHGDQLTEISMANYLMMGQGNRSEDMTISRINRMTPLQENQLVKPIFRPERVDPAMHMNHVLIGKAVPADPAEMRLLHYWGGRTQNWGPDTEETRNRTIIMNSFREAWAPQLRNSLLAFGETDVFSASTGP